jgi:hypothetical protein
VSEPTIIKCKIGPYPKGFLDPMPIVAVVFSDKTTAELFSFYPDELSFSESEFIGLTKSQAMQLRHNKDVAYLRS